MARPKGTKKNGLKFLAEPELKSFFKAIDSKRDRLMFGLTLYLGLRCQELINLTLKDIDLQEKTITIRAVKNGEIRTYLLPDSLYKKLRAYLKNHKHSRLFPFTTQTAKNIFKRTAARAKINNGHGIHALRHSCAMVRVLKHTHPVALMQWMRHKSITSTQVYFKQVQMLEDDAKAAEDFNGLV